MTLITEWARENSTTLQILLMRSPVSPQVKQSPRSWKAACTSEVPDRPNEIKTNGLKIFPKFGITTLAPCGQTSTTLRMADKVAHPLDAWFSPTVEVNTAQ